MKTLVLALCSLCGCAALTADAPKPPIVISLAGDSTVCNYPETTTQRGWGQFIQPRFDDAVVVHNLAKGGRSTKTFLSEGIWTQLLATKPTVVLIQFGHNDSHSPEHPEHTDPQGEYKTILSRFVDDVRAIGALPILVTPVQRRTKVDSLIPYADAMIQVANEKKVTVIDLHKLSGELYQRIGPAATEAMAKDATDNTHFNINGASQIAILVMNELVKDVPELRAHLKDPTSVP